MKKLMILTMMLIASVACAEDKKKALSEDLTVESLQERWDADGSLIKMDCNEGMCLYAIKGTAQIVDADRDLRSAWVAFLYNESGRKALPVPLKESYFSKEKWNFDCNDLKLNVSSIHYYDAKGNPVNSYGDDGQWTDIVPGSFGETVAAVVCNIDDEGDEDTTPPQQVPGEPVREGTVL